MGANGAPQTISLYWDHKARAPQLIKNFFFGTPIIKIWNFFIRLEKFTTPLESIHGDPGRRSTQYII